MGVEMEVGREPCVGGKGSWAGRVENGGMEGQEGAEPPSDEEGWGGGVIRRC